MTKNATLPADAEAMFLRALFPPITASTPCGDVLARRTANLLAARGIGALGEAAGRTADEMLGWRNFGQTCLNDVVAGLRKAGLRPARPEESDPTPVSELYIDSFRALVRLHRLGIETVGQLLSVPRSELLSGKNFGEVSLAAIDAALERRGFPRPNSRP